MMTALDVLERRMNEKHIYDAGFRAGVEAAEAELRKWSERHAKAADNNKDATTSVVSSAYGAAADYVKALLPKS